MDVKDILEFDGIVIRKIPNTVTSRWRVYPKKDGEFRTLKDNERFVTEAEPHPKSGAVHRVVEEVRTNNLKKYMIEFEQSTGSITRFSKKSSGTGDTIQEAYEDLLKKRGKH